MRLISLQSLVQQLHYLVANLQLANRAKVNVYNESYASAVS